MPAGYTFLPNTRTLGFTLPFTNIAGTSQYVWQLLTEACNKEALCVGARTDGYLMTAYARKWPTAPIGSVNAWGWQPREQDDLCQGTLVKQGYSCGQVSICRPSAKSCRGNSSAAPWQYSCTCQQGQQLSADGYQCMGPPFGSSVVFVEDNSYDRLFRAVNPKYRDGMVWLFKGSRLAIALVVNVLATQEPEVAELIASGLTPTEVLAPIGLVINNMQKVLVMFDRLIGMAPAALLEAWELQHGSSLDGRTPYEVSMSDTEDVYKVSWWGAAGFMTRAPPLLDMFRAALRNESLLSRATLRSMPLNYLFPHISSTLDYAAAPSGWWSGHGYSVLDAAMTIMISSRLPQLKLSGHPCNFTFAQLLDYWEASALATLQQKNYSWDATWGQGTSLDNETAPVRLLASGVFVHLWRRFGQRRYTFLQRFFHSLYELADRMPVYWIDLDRFRSGYFIAASVAAPEQDLLPFFEQTLKWDIGPAARQYLASEYNLPRRKQQLRQQAAADSQQSVP